MGPENAGRVIVSYGESEQKPDITQIQSTVESGYFSNIFDLFQKHLNHSVIASAYTSKFSFFLFKDKKKYTCY